MKGERPWLTTKMLDRILDTNLSPVARMRLFSSGVTINNRLQQFDQVSGDRGCLACGNCVDACPVVYEHRRHVFLQSQRTSMALENIVGDECRRCFSCVRACPQVSKPVKEYVAAYRRGIKIVHALGATLIILLGLSGIFMFHYGDHVPGWQLFALRAAHLLCGLALVATPLLYYLLDKKHFRRTLSRLGRFASEDRQWFAALWLHLKSRGRHPRPFWGEYNTYRRCWYSYLAVVIPLMAISGVISYPLGGFLSKWITFSAAALHLFLAFVTDILVLVHIYVNYLSRLVHDFADLWRARSQGEALCYPLLYDSPPGAGIGLSHRRATTDRVGG